LEVQSDIGVTRGQVDNEKNSQSQDSNISNNIHEWSLITESGNRALVRDIEDVRGNTARQCIHEWETQECRIRQEQEARAIL